MIRAQVVCPRDGYTYNRWEVGCISIHIEIPNRKKVIKYYTIPSDIETHEQLIHHLQLYYQAWIDEIIDLYTIVGLRRFTQHENLWIKRHVLRIVIDYLNNLSPADQNILDQMLEVRRIRNKKLKERSWFDKFLDFIGY